MFRRHVTGQTYRHRKETRPHVRPRLEALEPRTLLACEVFINPDTRTLFVVGDDRDNEIALVSRPEELRVVCDGVRSHIRLTEIDHVQVEAGGGNDRVTSEGPARVAMRIKGEDGDDTIRLHDPLDVSGDGHISPVDTLGGSGNDTVVIDAARAAAIVKIIGLLREVPDPEFTFFHPATGALLAQLFVQDAEAIALHTGSGDDRIEMHDREGLLSGIQWDLATGGGDDAVFIDIAAEDSAPRADAAEAAESAPWPYAIRLRTGQGNDDVEVAARNVDLHLIAHLGRGDDRFSAVMGIEPTPFLRSLSYDVAAHGGAGEDTLSAHAVLLPATLVGFNPQPEPPVGRFRIALRGGRGDDDLSAVMGVEPTPFVPTVISDVRLDGGAGDDDISVVSEINAAMGVNPDPFAPTVITTIAVSGGAGNDEISILADLNAEMGISPDPFRPTFLTQVRVDGGARDDGISVLADINAAMGVEPEPFAPANVVFDLAIQGGLGDDDINHAMGIEPQPFLPAIVIDVTIDGGRGDDVLAAEFRGPATGQLVAALRVALFAGPGNDLLRALWTPGAFAVMAFADGGPGFDSGVFSPGVRHVRVERVAGA